MPRTPRPALLRFLTLVATSLALLVMTALPALAAAGTKPNPETDPHLIGSIEQLLTTSIVGVAMAIIAWVLMPSSKAASAEDDHH